MGHKIMTWHVIWYIFLSEAGKLLPLCSSLLSPHVQLCFWHVQSALVNIPVLRDDTIYVYKIGLPVKKKTTTEKLENVKIAIGLRPICKNKFNVAHHSVIKLLIILQYQLFQAHLQFVIIYRLQVHNFAQICFNLQPKVFVHFITTEKHKYFS